MEMSVEKNMDQELFEYAIEVAKKNYGEKTTIGLLGEKILHSTIKYYYDVSGMFHEKRVGNFHADILRDYSIYEIQTRSFDKLRVKLPQLLEAYTVNICYPISHLKLLSWLNPETGEVSKPRKSPKIGTPYEIFPELYKIKMFLNHKNIRIRILLVDILEIRNLDGYSEDKKRRASRYDRIPLELVDEIKLQHPKDYIKLVPAELHNAHFTVGDYQKYAKTNKYESGLALNVLFLMGILIKVGKQGNKIIYHVNT